MRSREVEVSPDAMLVEFFDIVNSKLSVNLAVLEVVLYASNVISIADADFSLPKPWTKHQSGVMSITMAGRSLSAAMAYQSHCGVITAPESYINMNRPDHPFDYLLVPEQMPKGADPYE